jgi:hypothetical protein
MITNVFYKPHVYSAGYNPIVWSFFSNKAAEVDFSYLIDVYVNAATGSTTPTYSLIQRPNQVGVGLVDVSSIVQPFIELTDYSVEQGYNNNYRNSTEIAPTVFIKVGEQYVGASGGAPIQFNGYGTTGAAAFFLGSIEQVAYPVTALPAALPWETAVASMADTDNGSYGFFSKYMMGATGTADVALPGGRFLKRDSNTISVRANDHHTLSFINWNFRFAPGTWGRPVQCMVYKGYGPTGDPTNGYLIESGTYQNLLTYGGGPQTSVTYTSATWNKDIAMLTFQCGPKDIDPSPGVTYYTIQAYTKTTATASDTPNTVASELVTFNIDDSCQTLYPIVRLSWLNDLGGRDYYNFDMFYELTSSSSEQTYSQAPLNWNGTTPVVIDKVATNNSSNWMRGGAKSFNKVVERTFTIQSNWLTQEYVEFLGAIPESPSVWAYIGAESTPYTIIIDKADYTYKNVKQIKMVQATFVCKMTKTQPKQNY